MEKSPTEKRICEDRWLTNTPRKFFVQPVAYVFWVEFFILSELVCHYDQLFSNHPPLRNGYAKYNSYNTIEDVTLQLVEVEHLKTLNELP